jgi:hypothetical protein
VLALLAVLSLDREEMGEEARHVVEKIEATLEAQASPDGSGGKGWRDTCPQRRQGAGQAVRAWCSLAGQSHLDSDEARA